MTDCHMAKDNTRLVFHVPTQFYNGCYFPFVTPEGQAVYKRIQNQFRTSPHSDNALIDILDGLKKLYPTTIAGLALCELEMDGEPFWGSLLLDHRMALVSAFRHYTSLEHFSSDTQLRFEETILESMPNRQYLLVCSYFCDKSDKRHLFRFTYVDRQASFISAQVFDYVKDPFICAANMALMCGETRSPCDDPIPLRMPHQCLLDEPPRKRPHLLETPVTTPKFNDIFSKIWPPADSVYRQIVASDNGHTVWYTDGSHEYIKLSWEVVGSVENSQGMDRPLPVPGDHYVWDHGHIVKECGTVIPCYYNSNIRSILGIPPERFLYLRTIKRCSSVEIPFADLSLYHQISMIHLVLRTDAGLFLFALLQCINPLSDLLKAWKDPVFHICISPFRLYARYDPKNMSALITSFAWDAYQDDSVPQVCSVTFSYIVEVAHKL